jgi:hypothetical protein
MKYKVATIALTTSLAAAWIGAGLLKERHTAAHARNLRATVSAMSNTQLAAATYGCPQWQPDRPRKHDAEFCAEVERELESRPLQAVRPPNDRPP